MNKDQVKGSVKAAVGKVQQKSGQATGSTSQQAKGKAEKKMGDVKEAIKNDANRRP